MSGTVLSTVFAVTYLNLTVILQGVYWPSPCCIDGETEAQRSKLSQAQESCASCYSPLCFLDTGVNKGVTQGRMEHRA